MIIDQDGGVIVSNDGATIIKNLNIEHPIAKLLVELSLSQDDEIGDGTTAVVILVGALLEGALKLLDKGLHPHQIIEGYDKACKYALDNLEEIKFDKNKKIPRKIVFVQKLYQNIKINLLKLLLMLY